MPTMSSDKQIVCERQSLAANDGHRILVDNWRPSGEIRAVIHIFHGLSEHATRYDRFARQCLQRGIAVAAHNHRGHGETCAPDGLGHFADKYGWDKVIADALQVQQSLLQQYPEVPYLPFGHSMGSYLAQSFVMHHPQHISGLILSGSTWPNRSLLRIGRLLATLAVWTKGPQAKSAFLDKMSFGDFNKRFAPNRTEFDWLSRDGEEVDKYIADPLCGAPSSNQLWRDLFGGMLKISTAAALKQVPDIPVLIVGGELDPVGGSDRLAALSSAYRETGHGRVSLKIYPGSRHEILNETDRESVTADVLNWCDANTQGSPGLLCKA
jgi:alpha-beta hydrolase superfamily lysophospholipase